MDENKSFFQFENFLIQKSVFNLVSNSVSDLSVSFSPSGELDYENGKFRLYLGIYISDESESLQIELDAVGFFTFGEVSRAELSDFLFVNAPALLFPYLRAYISTLSTLSGINPVVLPTLNLISLKDDLASNIEEVTL